MNDKTNGRVQLFTASGERVDAGAVPTGIVAPGKKDADQALLRMFQRQLAVAQAAARDLAARLDRIKKAKDRFVDDIDDNGVDVVSPLILGDFLSELDKALVVPETIEAAK